MIVTIFAVTLGLAIFAFREVTDLMRTQHKARMQMLNKLEEILSAQRHSLHLLQEDSRELRKLDEEVRIDVAIRLMAAKLGVEAKP